MTYVADLHLHSSFAMGTSKDLSFESLARWAKVKGIDLLASADFTHPAWFDEMGRKLREAGDGLYEFDGVKFVLGTEVSCVVELRGKRRRVHLLLFAPSLETVKRVNEALAVKGNLESDGRPSLQISPGELVSTVLDVDLGCLVIPAHAWTPWFGIFGSKSGFDSLEECFGDTADHVFAIETGLSSDPAMNWRIPELDNRAIVSFSDAHSPSKLGRELTIIDGEMSYPGLSESLKRQRIAYTVEFFPQEGKYHYSGHRKCGVRFSPSDVARYGRSCPVCGRGLTLGVIQRVEELATRESKVWVDRQGFVRAENDRPPFKTMVSLAQIIGEALGFGPNAKRVRMEYDRIVAELGGELSVLTDSTVAELGVVAGERIAEGIARVRRGDISVEPGYDGVYGTVRVWPVAESQGDGLGGAGFDTPPRSLMGRWT